MAAASADVLRSIADADALRDAGQFDEALAVYKAIVEGFPESHEAHYKLGTCLAKLKQTDAAARCYREAISLWADYPEANNNLGLILFARGELGQAERHYRVALAERPDFLEAHLNLTSLLTETSLLLEAKFYARRALSLCPASHDAHARMGQVLRAAGQITDAVLEFQHAAELDPKFAGALADLGGCYWHLGRHREAEKALASALEAVPDFFPAWNNLLLQSNYRLRDREEVFRLHQGFGQIVRKECGELAARPSGTRPDANRRLRIGFISGDFRRHSVACFLQGALQHLDRREFQLFAYYNFRTEDEVTWRLKPLFHHWRSIYGVPDEEAAGLIRKDGVDILVDLAGHTASLRPMVLGRRPAPVQAHWIGYPNTTGLDCVDYRIVDERTDPVINGDTYSSEKLWRLPGPFLCYTQPDVSPDVESPPCLAKSHVTFGSFNSRAKLSEECVALWSRLLKATPDSRLVLKSVVGMGDEAARNALVQSFVAHGVTAERIEILKRYPGLGDHLAAYRDIDIALDPFPYNGTTTTCEALWMGVPVVALAGDRHASRVGVSLLNGVGLAELIAQTPDDYVRIATELATNRDRLAQFRTTLRERMMASRLMDSKDMGVRLGSAFHGMWQHYCAGFPAALPVEGRDVARRENLLRLNIGGQEAREGWKILDAIPRDEVDFVGDVRNLEAFADESCIEIYCSHVLEHVGQADVLETLNGLFRILAPAGRLYISVPDMDMLAWLFVNPSMGKPQRFQIMRMMFGGQTDEFDFHKIGLNFGFLMDYLQDVGFSSVEHVEFLNLFEDSSALEVCGHRVSLNLIVTK